MISALFEILLIYMFSRSPELLLGGRPPRSFRGALTCIKGQPVEVARESRARGSRIMKCLHMA